MSTEVRDATGPTAYETIDLELSGMTCASCANRIERKLNKLDGVHASVNYATERARVEHPSGMAVERLIGAVEAAGYSAREHRPAEAGSDDLAVLRRRLVVSAALSVPVLLIAMVPPLHVTGWPWVALVLTTPVALWGALPFHRAAATNLRHGATTMDTLVSTGVLAAYTWSLVALAVGDPEMTYFETAAGVTTFLLAGRYAEKRAKRQAGSALRALAALRSREVMVLPDGPDGPEVPTPIERLGVDQLFVVRPGERIATDGVVEVGTSAIDAAAFTGEAVPVEVGPGDDVLGATLNTTGRLVVRATRVGEATQLSQIARLVEDAQAGKAAVQRLADRISSVFVPVVIVLAMLTLVGWVVLGGGWVDAFTAAVAVLIIACPCALGLATPTALMVGTARGAQLGILIRGPEVLEAARRIDTVVLDKTGTVTEGRMRVVAVDVDGAEEQLVRRLAGTVEAGSEHPIARAMADGVDLGVLTDFRAYAGLGVVGVVDGVEVTVGRASFLEEQALRVPAALARVVDSGEASGATVVLAGWDGSARGAFTVTDTIAAGVEDAVARLYLLGQRVVLLTGDNQRAARQVAAEVGIYEVIAGVMPTEKAAYVAGLQEQGRRVAMVGDGINDAAALATADLGIAMGAGTDVAQAAADLTIVGSDLGAAVDGVRLSRRTFRIIRSNLVWAFGYNIAALPLAVAGLATPMLAGAAMALSSVFVVGNSLRLRRFR